MRTSRAIHALVKMAAARGQGHAPIHHNYLQSSSGDTHVLKATIFCLFAIGWGAGGEERRALGARASLRMARVDRSESGSGRSRGAQALSRG